MASYLFHRLTGALLVIFGVTGIVFLLVHLIPGDPVEIMLGESASVADREVLRAALGLDKPVLTQFYNYLGGLLQLDLGTSIHFRRPLLCRYAFPLREKTQHNYAAACERRSVLHNRAFQRGFEIAAQEQSPILIARRSLPLRAAEIGWARRESEQYAKLLEHLSPETLIPE